MVVPLYNSPGNCPAESCAVLFQFRVRVARLRASELKTQLSFQQGNATAQHETMSLHSASVAILTASVRPASSSKRIASW